MRRPALPLILAPALAACQPAAAPEASNVWARDTAGGTATAAVFMTIASPAPDRLIAATTPAAQKTDLMTMESGNGTMAMTYLKGIDIPAGKPVSLNPMGLHVWLSGLAQPLRAGQSFPLTLKFEKAGDRQVTVTVIAPAATPPGS